MTANNGFPGARDWRKLYSAALLEADNQRVPSLIEDAERAIVTRARQLFGAPGDNLQEQQALDDALLALRALKRCLAARAASAEAGRMRDSYRVSPASLSSRASTSRPAA